MKNLKKVLLYFLIISVFSFTYGEVISPPKEVISFQESLENAIAGIKPSVVLVSVKIDRSKIVKRHRSKKKNYRGRGRHRRRKRHRGPILNPSYYSKLRAKRFGAGIVLNKDGYILTNYWLVSMAKEIEVELNDKSSYKAELVGYDGKQDIAVMKIDAKENLTPAKFGKSSDIKRGDMAVAIGHPFGYTSSATFGIISATGRLLRERRGVHANLIQTDAAMNIGNVGGPLINLKGEVIGIGVLNPISRNLAFYGAETMATGGIGFAIPIDVVKEEIPDLINGKKKEYQIPWLGVSFKRQDEDSKGLEVRSVYQDGPADKAGLQRGDIIHKIDEQEIDSAEDLVKIILNKEVGDTITCEIIRDDEKFAVEIKLEKMPKLSRRGRKRW